MSDVTDVRCIKHELSLNNLQKSARMREKVTRMMTISIIMMMIVMNVSLITLISTPSTHAIITVIELAGRGFDLTLGHTTNGYPILVKMRSLDKRGERWGPSSSSQEWGPAPTGQGPSSSRNLIA